VLIGRSRTTALFRGAILGVLALTAAGTGCRRKPAVPEATYRQAVTAFYVSLAAMQTSQDVIARQELERVIQLVPEEAAAWANLGLLLLRQQQFEEAAQRLEKAAALAPRNAAIERLRGLNESRNGRLDRSTGHWRRAMELDGADVKAPFALAQDLERLGGPDNEAEAGRVFAAVAERSRNLAARLESARLAAKRGDGGGLQKALDALAQQSGSWPSAAQERFAIVRAQAKANPAAATTPVIFLKNVLIREPEYRAALAAVTAPRAEAGEPLLRLVTLPNPDPRPAPADERLAFTADTQPAVASAGASWAGPLWLAGDRPPVVAAAGPNELRLANGVTVPRGTAPAALTGDGVASADLNYDFRTDFVIAGAGLQIFRQADNGTFSAVTAQSKLPPDLLSASLYGVWPADIDTDGDLDLFVSRAEGAPAVVRNNGDGTFAVQAAFGNVARVRGFAWADLDGEGVPDAALLDDRGVLRVFVNLRGSQFRERPVPTSFPRVAAIAATDVSGDGIVDLLGIASDGTLHRLSQPAGSAQFETARVARADPPSGLTVGNGRLFFADLDNNGAADAVISTSAASRVLLAGSGGSFQAVGGPLPGAISAAADLDGDGVLELIAGGADGARVVRIKGEKRYHWQAIRPRAATATGDQRINSYGIGGEVEVRTGLHAQKQVISAPVVHFGLGEAERAEVARITWPNGFLQSEFDLAADAAIAASHPAWDARRVSRLSE
jgi:Tfp pilus assembly protein PilF